MSPQLPPSTGNFRAALKAAFPHTVPVLTGYLFMGAAFGILLQSQGYSFLWAGLMSLTIYAGAGQFVAVGLLAGPFAPFSAVLITLMVNARHVFYGFSLLDRFRDAGKARPYLIFGLTDETFSLVCSTAPPPGVGRADFYLAITLLDHLYWISGGVIGALLGARLNFNVKGIDFVMTALFVAIFVEQWREAKNRLPGLMGLAGSAACLALFGAANFMLPTMACLVLALTAGRAAVEKRMAR